MGLKTAQMLKISRPGCLWKQTSSGSVLTENIKNNVSWGVYITHRKSEADQ
jgi:hypothetical protein